MSVSKKVSMFYNARPVIFERAKQMRDSMTPCELKVWNSLKNKQISGFKFRSQHPIDIFIADFYCHEVKLVIEIDGGIHKSRAQKEYDIGREAEFEKWGIKVIRFKNEEVEQDINLVMDEIRKECISRKNETSSPL